MPLKYKTDILGLLKSKGYSTYRLRKEKLISQGTLQQIRSGELVSWANISRLCNLLNCDVGDIVTYAPGDDTPTGGI